LQVPDQPTVTQGDDDWSKLENIISAHFDKKKIESYPKYGYAILTSQAEKKRLLFNFLIEMSSVFYELNNEVMK
jgi:hypothetical protein